jgi:hypothetical protein
MRERLNRLAHQFQHCVSHVYQNDRGWYEAALQRRYVQLRTLTRRKIEYVIADCPEFEAVACAFTDRGKTFSTEGSITQPPWLLGESFTRCLRYCVRRFGA